MVLRRLALLVLWLLALSLSLSPAAAHKKERRAPAATTQQGLAPAASTLPGAMPDHDMSGMMEKMDPDRSDMSTLGWFLDWVGRLHPSRDGSAARSSTASITWTGEI